MKVDNRIKNATTVQFQDLAIGEVYENDEGIICIKTSDAYYEDSPYGKCIIFVGEEWIEEDEHRGTYVKPLEATLTIHGYKMKGR